MNTQSETTLAGTLGMSTSDLAQALRGKIYIPITQATPIDTQYFPEDTINFAKRWTRRVKLTFDPTRSVHFSRAGTSDKELMAIFESRDIQSCRDKVNGVKWLSDVEWKELFNAIRAYNDKALRERLIIAEDQYRLNPDFTVKKTAKEQFESGE